MVVLPGSRSQAASRTRAGAGFPRFFASIAVLTACVLGAAGCREPVSADREWTTHGRTLRAEVWMAGAEDVQAALESIHESVDGALALLDPSAADSALGRMNRAAENDYYTVESSDLGRAIRLALDYAQFTKGAFDPTVAPLERLYERGTGRVPTPGEIELVLARVGWDKIAVAPEAHAFRFLQPGMQLDLGAVSSGFALDVASRVFARPGSRAGLLRLEPGILAWGSPPGLAEWSVEVVDPRQPDRTLLELLVAHRGLGSVGNRVIDGGAASLILDPRSGRPATSDVLAAVAVADSVADACALAEAVFVLGSHQAGDLLKKMIRAEAVLLVAGNGAPVLLASASLEGKLRPSPELEAEVGGRVRYILPPSTIAIELPKPR